MRMGVHLDARLVDGGDNEVDVGDLAAGAARGLAREGEDRESEAVRCALGGARWAVRAGRCALGGARWAVRADEARGGSGSAFALVAERRVGAGHTLPRWRRRISRKGMTRAGA